MKPIIILPPGAMSDEDIQRLRDNDLCVVVSAEPNAVKFLDPIPSATERTAVEDAAIQLSRKILAPGFFQTTSERATIAKAYVDILVRGTKLDPEPSKEELGQKVYDQSYFDEMRRLAREEAKAERAAKREAKKAEQAAKQGGKK